MISELREEGSHEAAEYFEFLFDLEEETRRVAGPDTVIWNKPRLRDNKELVDRLRKVFTIFCQRTSKLLLLFFFFFSEFQCFFIDRYDKQFLQYQRLQEQCP